jgi:hypothetical protein
VRPTAVVVGDEGVTEGLQLRDRVGLPGLCFQPLLQGLLEALDFAAGAFTSSANRPDVGGLSARHARVDGGPPKRTMTELQARDFIGRLLRAWMDALV